MKNPLAKATLSLAAASLLMVPTLGLASINYGDYVASTVDFMQVTEAAVSAGDTEPLYGAPYVTGNTLNFDPVGFFAASANGLPDITDGNLALGVWSHANNWIDSIEFEEEGDFTLLGLGTDNTFVDVTASFRVDILEIDNDPLALVNAISATVFMTFTPNGDGTFQLFTDGGGGPLYQGDWLGKVDINLDAILDDAILNGQLDAYEHGVSKVSLDIDNILTALSEANTSSSITKKDFKGFAITIIPEPTTAALGLIGLAALLGMSRNRRV